MINALDDLFKKQSKTPAIMGEWFNIQWTPDIATGELFNVGVGFMLDGKIYHKILDSYERLQCLYDHDAIFHVKFLSDVLSECFAKNRTDSPLPQIQYKHKGIAQGQNIEEILETLYSQTVTLGRPKRQNNKRKFKTLTTDQLYKSLLKELENISNFEYSSFVPEPPSLTIEENNQKHKLYVPFRNLSGTIGSLASTVYSDPRTIENNLLTAARDVQLAIELGKGKTPFVFSLKPGSDLDTLPKKKIIEIENKLDVFDWHMNKSGINVASHVTTSGLADEIYKIMRNAA